MTSKKIGQIWEICSAEAPLWDKSIVVKLTSYVGGYWYGKILQNSLSSKQIKNNIIFRLSEIDATYYWRLRRDIGLVCSSCFQKYPHLEADSLHYALLCWKCEIELSPLTFIKYYHATFTL